MFFLVLFFLHINLLEGITHNNLKKANSFLKMNETTNVLDGNRIKVNTFP